MKIGVVNLATGEDYIRRVEPGLDSIRKYCATHNYTLFDKVGDHLDQSRPISWSKVNMIRGYMADFDWIFYCDSDIIIMNQSTELEGLMAGVNGNVDETTHLVLTRDPRGSINMGVFFIRNSEWSRDFLDAIYNCDCPIDTLWAEQLPVCLAYRDDLMNLRTYSSLENRTWRFNAYPREKNTIQNRDLPEIALYHQGDFLVHFVGLSGDVLAESMRNFAKQHDSAPFRNEHYTAEEMDVLFRHRGKKRGPDYVPDEIFS